MKRGEDDQLARKSAEAGTPPAQKSRCNVLRGISGVKADGFDADS